MKLDIEATDLKKGLLGLVVALAEIIKETLKLEALRRIEGGNLTKEEVERLGEALMDLDEALEKLKVEMGVTEAVRAVRDGLDQIVNEMVHAFPQPRDGEGSFTRSELRL